MSPNRACISTRHRLSYMMLLALSLIFDESVKSISKQPGHRDSMLMIRHSCGPCICHENHIFDSIRYESIDPELLPPLWLIYAANPSDSGAVHSDVRRRWKEGEPDVIAAMANFARIAQQGRCVSHSFSVIPSLSSMIEGPILLITDAQTWAALPEPADHIDQRVCWLHADASVLTG